MRYLERESGAQRFERRRSSGTSPISRLAICAFALASFTLAGPLFARRQEDHIVLGGKFQVRRATSPIKVDGRLDEAAWKDAEAIPLPYEVRPGENLAAPVKTTCRMTYDSSNLYVGCVAEDPNPSAIRARLTDRDRAFGDDFMGIQIDPFDDHRRAFEFFVNPLGVQMDLFLDDLGTGEDETWDAIWNSAGRITDTGYVVEFAIPFSSLRFPRFQGAQTWGVSFFRVYPRDNRYQLASQKLDRSVSCFVCQFSHISGFEGLTAGHNIELDPTATALRADTRPDFPEGDLQRGDVNSELGLTASWGVTPNLILNAALNPDFSQVEADALQLGVNEQFALFFPERRPFFLEGADFFATPLQAVFTRNVADPNWGLKVSGKQGSNALGVFVAEDAVTNLLFPGSQGSDATVLDMKTTDTVLRYRRDLGKNSALGALVTSREGGDYRNRVAGVDGLWRPSDADSIRYQYLGSHSEYPLQVSLDFEQPRAGFNDQAYRLSYQHESRDWEWYGRYQDVGRNFRADMGFLPQVDFRETTAGIARKWWGDKDDWWTHNQIGMELSNTTDQSGALLSRHTEGWLFFQGPRQFYGLIDLKRGSQSFNGTTFERNFLYVEGGAQVSATVRLDFNGRAGDQIDFANGRQATELRANPHLRLDLGRHLRADFDYLHAQLDEDASRLFTARLSEVRLVYQFNLRTFVRTIFQYTDIRRDPTQYVDEVEAHSERLFSQLLFSYKLNPQTVLFLGYSNTDSGITGIDRIRTDQTFFLKLGYAWRI